MMIDECWIETVGGNRVDFPDTDPDTICIEDIASALARVPRFNGHTSQPLSVARHSVAVAEYVRAMTDDPLLTRQALLHDATEAYLCDIPSPIKALLPDYMALEHKLWRTIARKFSVPVALDPIVKEADIRALLTERYLFRDNNTHRWIDYLENHPRMDHVFYDMGGMTDRDAFMNVWRTV